MAFGNNPHCLTRPLLLTFALIVLLTASLVRADRLLSHLRVVSTATSNVQADTTGTFSAGFSQAVTGNNGTTLTATASDGSTSTIRFNSAVPQINTSLSEGQTVSVTLGELTVTSSSGLPATQAPNFSGAGMMLEVNFTSPQGTAKGSFSGLLTGRVAAHVSSAELQWASPLTLTFSSATGNELKLTIEPTSVLGNPSGNAVIPIRAQLQLIKANLPPTIQAAAPQLAQGGFGLLPIATVADQETPAGSLTVSATAISGQLNVNRVVNHDGVVLAEVQVACGAPVTTVTAGLQLLVADSQGATSITIIPFSFTANTPPMPGSYSPVTIASGTAMTVAPNSPPKDDGTISSMTATAPGFTGTLSASPGSGEITISNAGPVGIFIVTVTATDNCGLSASQSFQLAVGSSSQTTASPNFNTIMSSVNGTGLNATAVADFNEDGISDLAITDATGTNTISLLPGIGNGTFGTPVNVNLTPPSSVAQASLNQPGTAALTARDFNGDGHTDLLFTLGDQVTILVGRGDGTFASAIQISTAGRDFTGDFNGDGRADLVSFSFASETGKGMIVTQLSLADGSFAAPVVNVLTNDDDSAPQTGRFGDFNGDGKPDFAAITDLSQYDNGQLVARYFQITIFSGNTDGTFTRKVSPALATFDLTALIATDFNDDGLTDLITTDPASDGTRHNFYRSTRETGFIAAGIRQGELPAVFRVADFNHDGRDDLAGSGPDGLIIRTGNQAGVFEQEFRLSVSGGLHVGYFNQDGLADLAIPDQSANVVAVLLSTEQSNTAPIISAVSAIEREPGNGGVPVTLALVNDSETAAGNLTVTLTSVPAGLVVSGLTNNNGTITATVMADCAAQQGASNIVLTVTDAGGLSTATSVTVNVVNTNVSSQTSFAVSGLIYDRSQRTFNGFITVTNISNQTISGALRLELTGLPAGVFFANATSLRCQVPYLSLAGQETLAPGQSINVPVRFSNPQNLLLSFTPQLHRSQQFVPIENLPPPILEIPRGQSQISPGRTSRITQRRVR